MGVADGIHGSGCGADPRIVVQTDEMGEDGHESLHDRRFSMDSVRLLHEIRCIERILECHDHFLVSDGCRLAV